MDGCTSNRRLPSTHRWPATTTQQAHTTRITCNTTRITCKTPALKREQRHVAQAGLGRSRRQPGAQLLQGSSARELKLHCCQGVAGAAAGRERGRGGGRRPLGGWLAGAERWQGPGVCGAWGGVVIVRGGCDPARHVSGTSTPRTAAAADRGHPLTPWLSALAQLLPAGPLPEAQHPCARALRACWASGSAAAAVVGALLLSRALARLPRRPSSFCCPCACACGLAVWWEKAVNRIKP